MIWLMEDLANNNNKNIKQKIVIIRSCVTIQNNW